MKLCNENPTATTGRKSILSQSGLALGLAITFMTGLLQPAAAQTVIGGQVPDSSAMLELRSTSRGFLLPRLSTGQRDAISKPQQGLMIFNTTLNCVEVNLGTTTAPDWTCLGGGATTPPPAPVCRAKVNATDYKTFLCHNLGAANTSADPFTPSWEIIGGYWQWGHKGLHSSKWLNTNTPNFAHGPTGPGAGQTNEAAIIDWSQTAASGGAWSDDSKTADDPCPQGYRVPTKAQWDAVRDAANNPQTAIGTFSNSSTNYSSGMKFGEELMLTAAGDRGGNNGGLLSRGQYGSYWSSTEEGTSSAWGLNFGSGGAGSYYSTRRGGFSLRCIAEDASPAAGSIGALNCGAAAPAGTLTAGSAASGVSASVPYTGGNGGTHNGQTVTSTGVTGLTATLAAGSFASGDGNLNYAISGTPSGAGTASFALNIGGQSCTLALTVAAAGPVCRAKVNATDYKTFLCHNLGAANTAADPFTPSWEIIGGYWQWGRKGPDFTQWLNTNTPNFAHGPTGPGAGQTNEADVNGWSTVAAPNGAWMDASKTTDDPCPQGFRVPTKTQWEGVIANNTQTGIGGSWNDSPINYSVGVKFGPDLMLPAAGYRLGGFGGLTYRGYSGYYRSSTENGTANAWYLTFGYGSAGMVADYRRYGFSLRCIAAD